MMECLLSGFQLPIFKYSNEKCEFEERILADILQDENRFESIDFCSARVKNCPLLVF